MNPSALRTLSNNTPLGEITKNVGSLFISNESRFPNAAAFSEKENGQYLARTWSDVLEDMLVASQFFRAQGLQEGDRIAIVAGNSYFRLICEMAAMACGFVAVPMFVGYPKETLESLLAFSDLKGVVFEHEDQLKGITEEQLPKLRVSNQPGKRVSSVSFSSLKQNKILATDRQDILDVWRSLEPKATCLIMYTSGTSQFPKGVQLSHQNILSQQAALKLLWKPSEHMRFLSYLPWHHSFGGLFERFFALHTAGHLHIDDSLGKDVQKLLSNFEKVKPHVFFSVPKIYQEIVASISSNHELLDVFFHRDLKFVFTAAAPLPLSTSNIFKSRGIPVVEGWGLTETSPCCTLTELSLDRELGVVGYPIPQTQIKLDDDNEILVKGPQVMKGYFRNSDATDAAFDSDHWFHTGDIGEITQHGLKILSRKDRMFKLSNGEKIFPNIIEETVKAKCSFVKYAYLVGKDQGELTLLVFPNFELIKQSGQGKTVANCESPQTLGCYSACLRTCLEQINAANKVKFEHIKTALIWDRELSLEQNELTPSFKLVPRKINELSENVLKLIAEQNFGQVPSYIYLVQTQGGNAK